MPPTTMSSLSPTNYFSSQKTTIIMDPRCMDNNTPPSQNNNDKVHTQELLDESEKLLYNKMRKDFTNKTISNAAILSKSSSSLSLLPQPYDDEAKQSHDFQRSTGDTNRTYIYREEHTFIQSEEFHDANYKDMRMAIGKVNIRRDNIHI
jgi:hypothetical protein